ncbi:hypothetical protein PT285_11070 [Lactobacillus sp. ESL0791]|uniref:hypothetical protein n=1 Tax=Lactobacillus sp. ESL0791 TaxID=2983234 RepID=UPI0023F9EDBC|nr:hypothetical protein [Lactobacillus sp. ESL0791]MDF7639942.1 hypothetical protein [Lactobacillus sp. ESL0791]
MQVLSNIWNALCNLWQGIVTNATAIAALIALIGLIYQIGKDINSKRAKYKIEINKRVQLSKDKKNKDDNFDSKNYQTNYDIVTIRNTGNRTLTITDAGFTKIKELNTKHFTIHRPFFVQKLCFHFELKPKEIATLAFLPPDANSENEGEQLHLQWKSKAKDVRFTVQDIENRYYWDNILLTEYIEKITHPFHLLQKLGISRGYRR